jgi:branched-chain amino acid transport system substrate-binding protein
MALVQTLLTYAVFGDGFSPASRLTGLSVPRGRISTMNLPRILLGILLTIGLIANISAEETVKVALIVPMSGPFANIGDLYVKHSQSAIDATNARGGVLGGRKLELVPMDNKNDPQATLLVLQQIVDRGIAFMIQSGGSHVAIPLADAVEKHNTRYPEARVLFFDEPGDYHLSTDKCSFWTFTFMVNSEIKMDALTRHLSQQPRIKRVYLINQDYEFGHEVQQFARTMLAQKRPDIEIVGDDLHALGKVKDFAPYVSKIKAAKADAVITGNWGTDMSLLVRAAREYGLDAKFYTYYGIGPGAPTAMGEAAIDRVIGVWRWHANLPNEKERALAHAYKRRYSLEYYAMPVMTLFDLLAMAIDRAGSTEALRVAYALEGLRLQGSLGEVWMRAEDHQLFEPLYILGMARINGRDIKYDLEDTGIGPRTEARFEAADLALPAQCSMQRPPRP